MARQYLAEHNISNKPCRFDVIAIVNNDFTYDKLIVVLGILSDKDVRSILSVIVPLAEVIVVTKSSNPRASDPLKLKEIIEELGFKGEIAVRDQIKDAVEYSKSIAREDDLVCVTGSLFTVGEARDYLIEALQKC